MLNAARSKSAFPLLLFYLGFLLLIMRVMAVENSEIGYLSTDIGYIGQEERQTNIYYHNNSLDQLWYGTNSWAVKFDLRSLTAIDSMTVETVLIYFPQAGDDFNLLIYRDHLQPLDSLAVSYSNITVENEGWYNLGLPANDYITGDCFWIVVGYETNSQNRFMGASATGGQHSYYWVPPYDPIPGYFANMAESNITSELLISIAGTLHFDGYDLELVSFELSGNMNPGGTVYPQFRVRNNSAVQIEDLTGVSIRLTNPHPDPDFSVWQRTYPLQIDLAAGADTMVVVTEPEYSYRLPGNYAQYHLQAELQYDPDLYPANNFINFSFNIFPNDRNLYLIENFIRSDHQPSIDILNTQQGLAADSLSFVNYFFHPDDLPYYTIYAAQQRDFYQLAGFPFTIIEGREKIGGYTNSYADQFTGFLSEVTPDKTFLSLNTTDIQKTIDPDDFLMHLRFDIQNDSTFVFNDNLGNLKMFMALLEKDNPELPGSHLIYLNRYQSSGNLNLGFGNQHNFIWEHNLQTIPTIFWEMTADNLEHFEIVYWLQDNQKKRIYYVGSFGLDEFELVVSVDHDQVIELPQPAITLYPNPLRGNESLLLCFNDPKSIEEVSIKIYNIKGQLIHESKSILPDSKEIIVWDGFHQRGHKSGNGLYFVKTEYLDMNGNRQTIYKKLLLLN